MLFFRDPGWVIVLHTILYIPVPEALHIQAGLLRLNEERCFLVTGESVTESLVLL